MTGSVGDNFMEVEVKYPPDRGARTAIVITIDREGAEWLADEMHTRWLATNDGAAWDLYEAITEKVELDKRLEAMPLFGGDG
jgi:hypothetical protein